MSLAAFRKTWASSSQSSFTIWNSDSITLRCLHGQHWTQGPSDTLQGSEGLVARVASLVWLAWAQGGRSAALPSTGRCTSHSHTFSCSILMQTSLTYIIPMKQKFQRDVQSDMTNSNWDKCFISVYFAKIKSFKFLLLIAHNNTLIRKYSPSLNRTWWRNSFRRRVLTVQIPDVRNYMICNKQFLTPSICNGQLTDWLPEDCYQCCVKNASRFLRTALQNSFEKAHFIVRG